MSGLFGFSFAKESDLDNDLDVEEEQAHRNATGASAAVAQDDERWLGQLDRGIGWCLFCWVDDWSVVVTASTAKYRRHDAAADT
mmetsp:Transcript_20510/g.35263  ORF Transcript_20510/g.35263 Transcript_20510/m.35263 type:complete len:84 (-) Transcript_20510:166-417(-)